MSEPNEMPADRKNLTESRASRAAAASGANLVRQMRHWARELGFSSLGVADIALADAEPGLLAWLHCGFHAELEYMAR
ncbi:MAG: tRNA epoxyqueuosine(34) reductase QueG, partial [Quisquiliibacterium sp.]